VHSLVSKLSLQMSTFVHNSLTSDEILHNWCLSVGLDLLGQERRWHYMHSLVCEFGLQMSTSGLYSQANFDVHIWSLGVGLDLLEQERRWDYAVYMQQGRGRE